MLQHISHSIQQLEEDMEERARDEKLEVFLGRRGKTLREAFSLAMRIPT